MKTIWYQDLEDVLLNIADPNTWWAISEVPWVSAPKINAGVSVYNVEADGWIAWWSTNVNWYASDYNTVARWSGDIYLPDWTSITISSGNTGNMSAVTYIYYDRDLWSVQTTTSAQASVWENKILLCVASPTSSGKDAEFQAFGTNKQSTFITADNIAANTITGNEIQANSIDTGELAAWAVTAGKIDVSQLSAISANLWTITAWDISWTTITAWNTSSWAWMKLYPYSSTQGRLECYYNWSVVWSIRWANVSWVGNAIYVIWGTNWNGYVVLWWNTVVSGKLRIPVWTNLYD